jgi:hypothetical protein
MKPRMNFGIERKMCPFTSFSILVFDAEVFIKSFQSLMSFRLKPRTSFSETLASQNSC